MLHFDGERILFDSELTGACAALIFESVHSLLSCFAADASLFQSICANHGTILVAAWLQGTWQMCGAWLQLEHVWEFLDCSWRRIGALLARQFTHGQALLELKEWCVVLSGMVLTAVLSFRI